MPSREINKIVSDSSHVPNKRERLASQYGQLNDIVSGDWNGDPSSLKDAINRLAASLTALLAKLDNDAAVADTDYESLLKP